MYIDDSRGLESPDRPNASPDSTRVRTDSGLTDTDRNHLGVIDRQAKIVLENTTENREIKRHLREIRAEVESVRRILSESRSDATAVDSGAAEFANRYAHSRMGPSFRDIHADTGRFRTALLSLQLQIASIELSAKVLGTQLRELIEASSVRSQQPSISEFTASLAHVLPIVVDICRQDLRRSLDIVLVEEEHNFVICRCHPRNPLDHLYRIHCIQDGKISSIQGSSNYIHSFLKTTYVVKFKSEGEQHPVRKQTQSRLSQVRKVAARCLPHRDRETLPYQPYGSMYIDDSRGLESLDRPNASPDSTRVLPDGGITDGDRLEVIDRQAKALLENATDDSTIKRHLREIRAEVEYARRELHEFESLYSCPKTEEADR